MEAYEVYSTDNGTCIVTIRTKQSTRLTMGNLSNCIKKQLESEIVQYVNYYDINDEVTTESCILLF